MILALAVSLFLARNWKKGGRLLFCFAACIAACVIPAAITGNTVKAPVSAEDLQIITEATAYRHQGDGLRLEGETLSEFQTMLEGLAEKKILWNKAAIWHLTTAGHGTAWMRCWKMEKWFGLLFFHSKKGLI